MKHLAIALLALVIATPAVSGIIFEDHFDSDSLSDYSQACYLDPSWPGSAVWQVSNGVLRGQSLGGTVCYAGVGGSTWDVSAVHIRMRNVAGIDKGVNLVNSGTNTGISVNLRSDLIGGDIMLGYNQPACCDILPLPHTVGTWMDVEIRVVAETMQIYINGSFLTARPILNPAAVIPINEVRPWTYTAQGGGFYPSINEFDDLIVEGYQAVPTTATSWGALKATYR